MIAYTRRKPKYKELYTHLNTLESLVGMQRLKESIVSQIQFIMTNDGKTDDHYLNTCLLGPPGCGKTTVAEILFKIWSSLELFDEGTQFTIIRRSDLVGSYMGHTATKTMKLLTKLSGGVIFIDETYTLVSGDKDEYGKEALDQINSFLSEEKGKTVMIFAGYENEINDRIFDSNAGLRRRFGWTFTIEQYTADQLFEIFVRQLNKYNWKCDKSVRSLFHERYDQFQNAGGDTENIAFKAKLEFSKINWMKRNQPRLLTSEHVKPAMDDVLHSERDDFVNMYI